MQSSRNSASPGSVFIRASVSSSSSSSSTSMSVMPRPVRSPFLLENTERMHLGLRVSAHKIHTILRHTHTLTVMFNTWAKHRTRLALPKKPVRYFSSSLTIVPLLEALSAMTPRIYQAVGQRAAFARRMVRTRSCISYSLRHAIISRASSLPVCRLVILGVVLESKPH